MKEGGGRQNPDLHGVLWRSRLGRCQTCYICKEVSAIKTEKKKKNPDLDTAGENPRILLTARGRIKSEGKLTENERDKGSKEGEGGGWGSYSEKENGET